MYGAAISLLTSVPPALTQENLDKQKELVERHIHIEAELIEKIRRKMPNIENKKVKLLTNAILQDEKRHHQLLREVLEILVRGETITEEDWWGILWKNVDAIAYKLVPFVFAALSNPQVRLALPCFLNVQKEGPATPFYLPALLVIVHMLLHPLSDTPSDIQGVFELTQFPEPGKKLLGLIHKVVNGYEWFSVWATPRP